jgi:hypothetical protein
VCSPATETKGGGRKSEVNAGGGGSVWAAGGVCSTGGGAQKQGTGAGQRSWGTRVRGLAASLYRGAGRSPRHTRLGQMTGGGAASGWLPGRASPGLDGLWKAWRGSADGPSRSGCGRVEPTVSARRNRIGFSFF